MISNVICLVMMVLLFSLNLPSSEEVTLRKLSTESTVNVLMLENFQKNSVKSPIQSTTNRRRKRQQSGVHISPNSPVVYDSLLTRRTFIPSFRMMLLELSLMTLSVLALNAVENFIRPQQKNVKTRITEQPYSISGTTIFDDRNVTYLH